MNKKDTILKWGAVAVAALIAAVSTISDQKELERVDDIDRRLKELEKNEEE